MPPKPTCKVVKREGQRGARIDPKGCKVRTAKDAQGNKRQYNKQGQEKFKLAEFKEERIMTIAGSRQYATVVRHWRSRRANSVSSSCCHARHAPTPARVLHRIETHWNILVLELVRLVRTVARNARPRRAQAEAARRRDGLGSTAVVSMSRCLCHGQ